MEIWAYFRRFFGIRTKGWFGVKVFLIGVKMCFVTCIVWASWRPLREQMLQRVETLRYCSSCMPAIRGNQAARNTARRRCRMGGVLRKSLWCVWERHKCCGGAWNYKIFKKCVFVNFLGVKSLVLTVVRLLKPGLFFQMVYLKFTTLALVVNTMPWCWNSWGPV